MKLLIIVAIPDVLQEVDPHAFVGRFKAEISIETMSFGAHFIRRQANSAAGFGASSCNRPLLHLFSDSPVAKSWVDVDSFNDCVLVPCSREME